MNMTDITISIIAWKHLLFQAQELAARMPELGLNPDKLVLLPVDDLVSVLRFLKRSSAEREK